MDLSSRKVYLCGITKNPNTAWMMQVAKNMTNGFDGFLVLDGSCTTCGRSVTRLVDLID